MMPDQHPHNLHIWIPNDLIFRTPPPYCKVETTQIPVPVKLAPMVIAFRGSEFPRPSCAQLAGGKFSLSRNSFKEIPMLGGALLELWGSWTSAEKEVFVRSTGTMC